MPVSALNDGEFIALWERLGSPGLVAKEAGIAERNVHARRARLAKRGIVLKTRAADGRVWDTDWQDESCWTFPRVKEHVIENGAIIISSDHHYWPGEPTLAHTALLNVIKAVKPVAKILNGDIFDGVSVSRHPPFGWSKRPSVKEELEACQLRVGEIEQALPKGCLRLWNIGNHDIRFERTLATNASEFEGMSGWRLEDHFHGWDMQWSTLFNPDAKQPFMVKHRQAGGIHAGYNNTMKGGLSVATGHTHILEAKPFGDWRGRRWGIQTGTLADCDGPQFEYQENNASPACSGFVVVTFRDGVMLPPELCEVIGGKAYFRGGVVA